MDKAQEIIAEKYIVILNENVGIDIQVLKPKPDEQEGGDWSCSFVIKFKDITEQRIMYGVDSFQALSLTLKIIPSYLTNFLKRMKIELPPSEREKIK